MLNFESFVNKQKVEKYNQDLINICKNKDYDLLQIGVVDKHQIFKITINPEASKTICFISGIHGDEPAGPMGILKFLEKTHVSKNKKIIIIPLVNPTGFEINTRENKDNIDINREFFKKEKCQEAEIVIKALRKEKPSILVTLHEDPGLKSFYLYYTDHKKLSEELREVAKGYFKIYDKENRKPIKGETESLHGDKIHNRLIPLPHTRRGTVEDFYYDYGIPYITTETVPENLRKSRRRKIAQIPCSILASQKPVSLPTPSRKPEPSSPQAFYVSVKLAATNSKLTDAL